MPPESHNLLNFLQSVKTWWSKKYMSDLGLRSITVYPSYLGSWKPCTNLN